MDNLKLLKRCRYLLLPLFSVFVFVFFLAVIEAGFHFYSYLKSEKKESLLVSSFCCGFKLKKNYSKPPIRIDHRGFRKTPFDYTKLPQSKVYKIVVTGDSGAFGWTNAGYLNYPAYLELILNSPLKKIKLPEGKRYIDVINAGIPTYTSDNLKNYIKHSIVKLDPDIVIISIGFVDLMTSQTNPVLKFIYKYIPISKWYFNQSSSISFLEKVVSSITSKTKQSEFNPKKESEKNNESDPMETPGYLEYGDNIREIVKILKEKKIIPVLMPWFMTPGAGEINYVTFDNEEIMDKHALQQYIVYAEIMENISKEFDVPFHRMSLQQPLVPKKINAKYFFTSIGHLNNYGAKIVGLSLANAITGILEGKNNDDIFLKSFASKPNADMLDRYVYIVSTLETDLKVRKQETIEALEKNIADYCIENTKEDMTIQGHHLSECLFAVPDTAFYQMRQRHYSSAKHYLDYAVDRYPKWAYPYFIYGLYHFKLGNHNEAELFFNKAAQLAPFFKAPQQYINRMKNI